MAEGRVPVAWLRRAAFAAVLVIAAVAPGPASGSPSSSCRGSACEMAGTVRWARLLPGSWAARPGEAGTVPVRGQAYAGQDARVAALGTGLTVYAYEAGTGQPLWTTTLTGFPLGSAIVAVRVWPGLVTAGVSVPGAAGSSREEVVLAAGTGRRLHEYPAAPLGGAVAAGHGQLVVVGPAAVTSYGSRGRVRWRRPTGAASQAWQTDGTSVYVTVARGGYLGSAPVTALRRISLRTGAQRLLRPRRGGFAGSLSLAFGGAVLFTDAGGTTAYSAADGRLLWRRPGALPEGVDAVGGRIYLAAGNRLLGVSPGSGRTQTRMTAAGAAGSSGLYAVRDSVFFGLDNGAGGEAWGYSVLTQRVMWTSAPLPWPHYFVDLSGIGGSTTPDAGVVLLAICAQTGPAPGNGSGQPCARPELVSVTR